MFRKKSIEHNVPFWYYYQGVAIDDEDKPTNEQIKYQMYVGLAYGAKQLSEWTCTGDALNSNGSKTDLFEVTKQRNAEVMAVGNYLFDKTSTAIYHTGLSSTYNSKFYLDKFSDSTLFNYKLWESPPDDLIISVFEDGVTTNKYLLVVNEDTSNEETGKLKLKSNMTLNKLDKATGSEVSLGTSNSISLNISAGSAEVYILK